MNRIDFPKEAKPHEIAILVAYALGNTNVDDICRFLHYASDAPVYKVLREYRDFLPKYRGLLTRRIQYVRQDNVIP